MQQTIADTFAKLWTLDKEVFAIAWLSLRVSVAAVALGSAIGIPAGALIAITNFPGRSAVTAVLNAFMGLPAVVVGAQVRCWPHPHRQRQRRLNSSRSRSAR